jgi:L-malate glycosyltransferase
MHVLFIVNAYHHSYNIGSGVFLKEQALAVSGTGVKTGLIAVNFVSWKHILKTFRFSFGFRQQEENGICAMFYQTPVLPFLKTLNHRRRDALLKKLSDKYFQKYGKPDICHVHGFYCGYEAVRLKKTMEIPYVVTEHYSVFARDLLNKNEKKRALRVYMESAARIAVSEDFSQLLAGEFGLKFQYIPNIVHTDRFFPKEQCKDKKVFRFLNVGSLDSNKNQQMILHAFSRLKNTNSILTIAGCGNKYHELKKLAMKLGIENRTEFVGYLNHQELPALYQSADALVVSSQYETFGIVIIEAMSCGLPVISTPVGVAVSLLYDHQFGYICNFDPEDMAKGMKKVMENEYVSASIHQFVADRFSAAEIARKLLLLYHNVLN